MNYEEKYKQALERASKLRVQNPFDTVGQMVEHIFPELKESEDERIRKAIKSGIKHLETKLGYDAVDGVDILDIYSWLEKQGEQKSVKSEQNCYHNDGLYYAIDILEKTFGKVEGYQSDDGKMEHQTAIETVNALYHKKPAWSEEDEHCIELLLPIIDSSSLIPKNRKKCKEFLKSIKPNHWKPSEEQLRAIINSAQGLYQCKEKEVLLDLYEQLKKL